jgi:hypothetical protein
LFSKIFSVLNHASSIGRRFFPAVHIAGGIGVGNIRFFDRYATCP